MAVGKQEIGRLFSQLSELREVLAEQNHELTSVLATGILNSCPLVRPDWRESACRRVMTSRHPILYTSHFEFEADTIPGYMQRCLYMILTHLIELVAFEAMRETAPCGRLLANERIANLQSKTLPELFVVLAMMDDLSDLAPDDMRHQAWQAMDQQLKEAIEEMREGEPV